MQKCIFFPLKWSVMCIFTVGTKVTRCSISFRKSGANIMQMLFKKKNCKVFLTWLNDTYTKTFIQRKKMSYHLSKTTTETVCRNIIQIYTDSKYNCLKSKKDSHLCCHWNTEELFFCQGLLFSSFLLPAVEVLSSDQWQRSNSSTKWQAWRWLKNNIRK